MLSAAPGLGVTTGTVIAGIDARNRGYDRGMAEMEWDLTVAVTGPTGTFGFGLIPLLEGDERVKRVIGIARRPFDPAEHGWSKMEYRRGDVRDHEALKEAFEGADVVVHLAFQIIGASSSRRDIHDVNVQGTLNALRAAAGAGARRFVYASSVAAYGFHPDNPVGMAEDWPTRPARRLFYARQKAELEHLLRVESAAFPSLAPYVLRPPIVLGPHAAGAKDLLPRPLAALGRRLGLDRLGRVPVPLPVAVPALPVQFVHENDVGQALLLCTVGAGQPGAYNIAADGTLTLADVARELGFAVLPVPMALTSPAARLAAALPRPSFLPPALDWLEAAAHPTIVDTTKAKEQLGWSPRYTALEALRQTIS
jgi:nucleoside-diphosphate-sugar epimerase